MPTVFKLRISNVNISLLFLTFFLSAAADFISAGTPEKTEVLSIKTQSIPVKTIILGSEKSVVYRSYTGISRSSQHVSARSQVSGRIMERSGNLGDKVLEGDILARLYNPQASPSALAAEQDWEYSKVRSRQSSRDFLRIKELYKSGVASLQEFESTRTHYLATEAAQSSAKSRYQQAIQIKEEQLIRAPFNGIVTQVIIEEGEVVSAGQAILQLANPDEIEIEITVSEFIASRLRTGDLLPITLSLDNSTQEIQGKIKELTPFRERGALPTVVVSLSHESARPGLTAYIHFSIEDDSPFVLPISSVIKMGTYGSGVYRVIKDDRVELVPVRANQIISDKVTVSGKLNIQDKIVIAGTQQLFDGAKINIISNSEMESVSINNNNFE